VTEIKAGSLVLNLFLFLNFEHFTMTDARFLAEVTETKGELQRLKGLMSMGAPTVHKDFSLISLVPKWSGLDSEVTLEEFLTSIEASAKIEPKGKNAQPRNEIQKTVERACQITKKISELNYELVDQQNN